MMDQYNTNDMLTDKKAGFIQQQRPSFPKRAVITAGMPYGNKTLHFGHVGGLFIHADIYAHFLRDRIGRENVLFVSGTDCYGSAIEADYEKQHEAGMFSGTIEDFVRENHLKQKKVLEQYGIKLDFYGGSALDEGGRIHQKMSAEIFDKLYQDGYLTFLSTKQFYDKKLEIFLNGRQVTGRCPIQGCKSEVAYADECALGHQFSPEELIAPVSTLSAETPVLQEVKNWYFDLETFAPVIEGFKEKLNQDDVTRKYLISVIEEFLRPPSIYIKREYMEDVSIFKNTMPDFDIVDNQKPSVEIIFSSLDKRKAAVEKLMEHGIRFRTGKTLVPFRISGNVAWGIPVPAYEGADNLTFWCWPESLWAPISFTKACLKELGREEEEYKAWWNSKEAQVYQFIGEDNIYFYSVAQTGIFAALQQEKEKTWNPGEGQLQFTTVVPNRHVLYMKKKASSSGAAKPPMAEDLLSFYSKEQLRLHFFHMNLAVNSVGFAPKAVLEPEQKNEYDPVVYEGNLLTNIFNRLIRSCFYTLQKYFDGVLPKAAISFDVKQEAVELIVAVENAMYRFEFNRTFELLDQYLRQKNKVWAEWSRKIAVESEWAQLLVDSFHAVRTALTLLHPMVPEGTEKVRDYLGVDLRIWDWTFIFEPLHFFFMEGEMHQMKFLKPRVDFFEKPEMQYQK